MSAIGPGSRVKCIKADDWRQYEGSLYSGPLPVCGGVYVVIGTHDSMMGPAIALDMFGSSAFFLLRYFRPLDGIDDLSELVREAKNPDAPAEREREYEYVVVRP